MMRLLLGFVVLVSSVWIGTIAHDDPGYVLITYRDWVIETPLWFSVMAGIMVSLTVYGLIRTAQKTHGFFKWIKERWQIRAMQRGWQRTTDALIELLSGHFIEAENQLLKSLPEAERTVLHHLALAYSAHGAGHTDRQRHYLQQAEQAKSDPLPILLMRTRLAWENGDREQAKHHLEEAFEIEPSHPLILRQLKTIYQQLECWPALCQLIPHLAQQHLITLEEEAVLLRDSHIGMWRQAINDGADPLSMDHLWQHMPRVLQEDSHILALYARYLMTQQRDDEAEPMLRKRIQRRWSNQLIEVYGQLQANLTKQLKFAKKWQQIQPDNHHVLFCVARLSVRHHLWGQAKHQLERLTALDDNQPEYHQLLGDLHSQLGETALAADAYRQASQAQADKASA